MSLHPQVLEMLELLAETGIPRIETQTPEEARRDMRRMAVALGRPDVCASVRDVTLEGAGGEVAARVYTPRGRGPFPVLVWYHGGGWVIGDLETHDALSRLLAQRLEAVVVSVDYRLAPEHRFPAAAEDAWAAARDVARRAEELGGREDLVVVGGDSAGGNLAAVACLMARERGGPRIGWQALVYPITDSDLDTPSYRRNAEGYVLTRPAMEWFWDHYVPRREDRAHPYASPLRAESLRGLPPALVLVAGYDPLRDEGVEYARRLESEGVRVTLEERADMIHGFVRMTNTLDVSHEAMATMRRELDRAIGR